jgi:kumamolisin
MRRRALEHVVLMGSVLLALAAGTAPSVVLGAPRAPSRVHLRAGSAPSALPTAGPALRTLAHQTPDVVLRHTATLLRHHDATDILTLDIGLAVRDRAGLAATITAASDPRSPHYGHYLTRAEYKARYGPLPSAVAAVRAWARGAGLTVVSVTPENLLVMVRGTTRQVERALSVTINDYWSQGREFYANDHDATVPAGLDITAISGLSTFDRFVTFHHMPMLPHTAGLSRLRGARNTLGPRSTAGTECLGVICYFPQDFISAYNIAPVGDGSGQTIGLTVWGPPVPQSDLHTFAQQTGTTEVVSATSPLANTIEWIPVDGTLTTTTNINTGETALDVEYAHGVAENSHLKYYLANCTVVIATSGYNQCNPSDVSMEQTVNAAANDASLHIVSNSWGSTDLGPSDPSFQNMGASFEYAASAGTTFYFSSGDGGAGTGGTFGDGTGVAVWPADYPWVVAVGGTTLTTTASFGYSAESAWIGSGGGCSPYQPRPVWQQSSLSAAICPAGYTNDRVVPDVAADANPHTGAWFCANGTCGRVGGTSLAAPLWAGMSADLDRYLGAISAPLMGFAAPTLYALAKGSTYAQDFHDVTAGNNGDGSPGYSAGAGWDEVTGWGSPNLGQLAPDWAGQTVPPVATVVATGTVSPLSGGAVAGTLPSGQAIDVRFPSNAVSTTIAVTVTALGSTPPPTPPDGDQIAGEAFALTAVNAAGQPVTTFNGQTVTVTFGYPASSDPSTLVFGFYSTATNSWQPLTVTNVDTSNHLITATTSHFTTFAIVGLPSPPYICTGLDPFRGLGDLDGNGQIDLTDFSIFAGDYGKDTSQGAVLNSPYSDMDCDGVVDLTDFSIFATYYGR